MNKFEIIRKILENAQNIKFYKDLYQNKGVQIENIRSIEDFKTIPFVSKESVMGEMLHVEDEETTFTRATSGTSGRMSIFHRSKKDREIHLDNFRTSANGYFTKDNRVMIIFPPDLSFIFSGYFSAVGCEVCFGDVYDLNYSANLINETKVDTLRTTPMIALKIGKILKRKNYKCEIINIILSGSMLSLLTRGALNDYYPEAKIIQNYGLAETGLIGWQCPEIHGTNSYHIFEDTYLYEIIDSETKKGSNSGELVISNLWVGSSSTLIRYKTGDHIEKSNKNCKRTKHGSIITFRGRYRFDVLKLKGLTLYKDLFEKALLTVTDYITDTYQLHLYEEEKNDKILPQLILKVIPKEGTDKKIGRAIVERRIMSSFMITPKYTFKDGVDKGLFLPIKVEFVDNLKTGRVKTQDIIDHRG